MKSRSPGYRFKKVVDSLLRGEPVFIKGTGVRVNITRLNDRKHYKNRLKTLVCEIEFIDTPNYKALSLCEVYDIQTHEQGLNRLTSKTTTLVNNRVMQITANIKVLHLDYKPYETETSEILYGKKSNK